MLTSNIAKLLGSKHPVLDTISSYYFSQQGKHIRPLIVLLMSQVCLCAAPYSQATSYCPRSQASSPVPNNDIDTPLDPVTHTSHHWIPTTATPDPVSPAPRILPSQHRLAEITEMIHTASLLHDDVIDNSPLRRGRASANAEFGNKMAILAGDFLLARASVALARLRDVRVLELLASVISNLVEGEFMQVFPLTPSLSINFQLRSGSGNAADSRQQQSFDYYLEKTYLKTASLIAKSCRACTVLGGCSDEVTQISYAYGKNIGMSFQVAFLFSLMRILVDRRYAGFHCAE